MDLPKANDRTSSLAIVIGIVIEIAVLGMEAGDPIITPTLSSEAVETEEMIEVREMIETGEMVGDRCLGVFRTLPLEADRLMEDVEGEITEEEGSLCMSRRFQNE